MWANYANNHKGMCLVFEKEGNEENIPLKVKCDTSIPKINYKKKANFTDVLITKSDCWAYEKESRQILSQSNNH